MVALPDVLRGKLSKNELALLRRSFDVVGDIAILEIPRELKKKEKVIAEAVFEVVKQVKVVAVEVGEHKGRYRVQKLRRIAGERRFETVQKESGVLLKLNVQTCYFSPRLGTERLRIAKSVREGERVLVAGSGIGVYPLVIARHSAAKEVVGVEWNFAATKFAKENVVLNKLENRVRCMQGDVTKVRGKFDRVVVAIPHEGVTLVPFLLKNVKKGGFLHVLDFAKEEDMDAPAKLLEELCAKKKRRCVVLQTIKAGQPGVRRYRVCVDAQIQ